MRKYLSRLQLLRSTFPPGFNSHQIRFIINSQRNHFFTSGKKDQHPDQNHNQQADQHQQTQEDQQKPEEQTQNKQEQTQNKQEQTQNKQEQTQNKEEQKKQTGGKMQTIEQRLETLKTSENREQVEQLLKQVKQLRDNQQSFESQLQKERKKSIQLDGQLTDNVKKMKQLRDSMIVLSDEMDVLRQRTEKEKQEMKVYAISNFAKDVLEIQDNLKLALDNAKKEQLEDGTFDGVSMTYRILEKILNRHGVVELDPLNEKFDPNMHEAMFQVQDPEKEDGTVSFVAQKGYMIGQRVLRAPKVGVIKNK